MKFAAGVLTLLLVTPAAPRPPAAAPPPPAPTILPTGQEWLAEPVLPAVFRDATAVAEPADDAAPSLLELRELLVHSSAGARQDGSRPESPAPESAFPRGVGAPEIEAWRREDELRQIREWASSATLAAPLLVPQLLLESFLPRGLAVGPTTFLYKTESPSSSLPLVVFDQVLFHEAQFVAQAREYSDAAYTEEFQRGQRRVLRRSLMSGFRANYAMPRMSIDQIFQTADEQGVVGYILLPPVAGALLYLKGIDQKLKLDDDVRVRFRLASGQDALRGLHSQNGNPAFSVELRLCDFPVGIIASFDVSQRGMIPSFVGIGTTLDVVEELLSREASSRLPPDAR